MRQEEALRLLKSNRSVLLTGEPGSGKTYTVLKYIDWLRSKSIGVAVTASTGIAATHINGSTIHSWSGIGIKSHLTQSDLRTMCDKRWLVRQARQARVLIIDEISMLSGATLDLVDQACVALREDPRPFGGLQVVLVGDFFQLPPVSRQEARSEFAFCSMSWQRLAPTVCYLDEKHRQTDERFLEILAAIRNGAVSAQHIELLATRQRSKAELGPETKVTQLFCHNADVDRINNSILGQLPGAPREYKMRREGQEGMVAALIRGCPSPETLVLKEGARVLFTKNNPSQGYVNGTVGTVVGYEKKGGNLPVVQHSEGVKTVVEPAEWVIEAQGGQRTLAKVVQVPLRLAWAITVHKSQGMSLDAAHIDLTRAFEYGQGYVALSRVRTPAGLTIEGLNERALEVHPQVLEYDQELRRLSAEAEAEPLA